MSREKSKEFAQRTIVTFKTRLFNTSQSKDFFINEACWGDDLCLWLKAALQARGCDCQMEPGQEDFGWYLNFSLADEMFCLVCGFRPESLEPQSSVACDGGPGDKDGEGVWVIYLERALGFWRSVLGFRSKDIKVTVAKILHEILTAEAGISQVKWHKKEDFAHDREELGLDFPE